MNRKILVTIIFSLSLTLPVFARGKKHTQRAMIEKMEAVPCGAKERGVSGIGSVFASIGATRIDSDEKLCQQYMLRTDDMEYHIRPLDRKHPQLLPVGQEGEFKISKNVLEMRIPDGDHKKRRYQVVAMKPIDHSETVPAAEGARMKYDTPQKGLTDKQLTDKPLADKVPLTKPN
jgi:hypothetical protein